jgi:hypothetical protein
MKFYVSSVGILAGSEKPFRDLHHKDFPALGSGYRKPECHSIADFKVHVTRRKRSVASPKSHPLCALLGESGVAPDHLKSRGKGWQAWRDSNPRPTV